MGKYFQTTDSLFDITEKYPETVAVFGSNGFPQMEDETQRANFGKMITFDVALQLKQKNPDTFIDLLEEVIDSERNGVDATLAGKGKIDENGLNVVGLLPCPVRIPLLESYNKFAEIHKSNGGSTFNTDLKAASMGTEWVEKNIDGVESAKDLPDLFISAGFDLFFDQNRIGKFRDRGDFVDLVEWNGENPLFAGRGLQDPQKNYSIISIVPAVFLINTKEVGDRKIPESWEDLLSDEWEESVSLPVGDFDLFNAILLNIHKKYGDAGVKKLGKSMLQAMHPSQMVKSDRLKQKRPAITIMPYFFTKTVKEGGTMKAVWPSDGAIVSPIFMLAKKEKAEELKPLVDFFASKEVGEILAHSGLFPSLNPEVDNRLDNDKPLMWLGWDDIMSKDLSKEIEECNRLFNEEVK
jgi:ABC-type Fe3+ transport system substrate-binding protein